MKNYDIFGNEVEVPDPPRGRRKTPTMQEMYGVKVEAFGCAVLWIAFIIVGALYCPLWVIGKAADYVKAHIKWVDSKNQENNEDDPSDWEF